MGEPTPPSQHVTIRADEGPFAALDGVNLYERWWVPAEPRAAVLIVHGLAEHSGRYAHVGQALAAAGYAAAALDMRGHGKSGGPRALVRSFDALVGDVEQMLGRVRLRLPGLPVFLLGHSMGGTVVALLLVTRRHQLAGAILSGPLLRLGADVSPAAVALARVLGSVVPNLPLQRVPSSAVSRDPAVVAAYDADPLSSHGGTKAGMGRAMLDAMGRVQAGLEGITLPLLLLHGGADRLTSPESSRDMHRRVQSADKAVTIYEGLYHEVLNEPEQGRVLADIIAWLDARAP